MAVRACKRRFVPEKAGRPAGDVDPDRGEGGGSMGQPVDGGPLSMTGASSFSSPPPPLRTIERHILMHAHAREGDHGDGSKYHSSAEQTFVVLPDYIHTVTYRVCKQSRPCSRSTALKK